MINCKQAMEDSPCKKLCCCLECESKDKCDIVCSKVEEHEVTEPKDCEDAIVDYAELVAFEEKTVAVIQAIADIATKKKELEDQDKKMREQLEAAMDQFNVKSFENDLIKITYVEPTTRINVDSAKLKKKYPEIFVECCKTSEVKGSVRITVK